MAAKQIIKGYKRVSVKQTTTRRSVAKPVDCCVHKSHVKKPKKAV